LSVVQSGEGLFQGQIMRRNSFGKVADHAGRVTGGHGQTLAVLERQTSAREMVKGLHIGV
jgi:hypothetical protein